MAPRNQRNLTETDRTPVDLWTAHPMTFHTGRGQFVTFPRFTPCRKPAYTQTMRDDLDRLARSEAHQCKPGDFWAFVDLGGRRRQVLRSRLLSQKEYDALREKDRQNLLVLSAKKKTIPA